MKYRWQTLLLIGILTGIFLTGNVSALAAESSGEGGTESIEEDIKSLNKLLDWWTESPYDHYNEWLSETYDALKKAGKA